MSDELALVHVDARGLEPPQPMVRILEAVADLPAGATLHALTDRRPLHLYAHLEAQGFRAESQEQPDGSVLTHIMRA
jgi:TusA-related sulfurtransferase